MTDLYGELFLDKLFSNLYISDVVEHTKKNTDSRKEAIKRYLDRLDRIHKMADTDSKKRLLLHYYIDKYLVKEKDLSDIIDKKSVIDAQKKSLEMWIDFLSSSETDIYPTWVKYWAFQGMVKLGSYDEFKGTFNKRDKNTINPFIEPNGEILCNTMDTIMKLVKGEVITTDTDEVLTKSDSFKKIYTTFYNKYKDNVIKNESEEGIWITYTKTNEDISSMINSIKNKDTGWCIASESYAKGYREHGDFLIYYTKDEHNEYKNPRIVILKEGETGINQIRGIENGENLEECMLRPLEKKLKEMNLDDYVIERNLDIINNLRKLTRIGIKTENNEELTVQELNEFYTTKYGFGYPQDPKFNKILGNRNPIEDYKRITDDKVKINMMLGNYIPENYIDDKNLMIKALLKSLSLYKYANEELRKDKDIFDLAVSDSLYRYNLQFADESIKKNKSRMLELLTLDAEFLEYCDPTIKDDEVCVFTALNCKKFSLTAFKHASLRIRNDKKLVEAAGKIHPFYLKFMSNELKQDREFILKMIKDVSPEVIGYITPNFEDDNELISESVKRSGRTIEYASDRLKDDNEIAVYAVSNDGSSFIHLSDRLQNNKELFKIALDNISFYRNNVLFKVNKEFYKDSEIFKKAVIVNPMLYQYGTKDDKINPNIAANAYISGLKHQEPRIVSLIPKEVKNDPKFIELVEEYNRIQNKTL